MNEITILPVNSTLGCLNSLIMAEILILLGKIPNFVLGNFTSFFSASHLYMFHRKLRFSLGEAQSICQCIEHACIWYIYIYTHAYKYGQTHIYICTPIYTLHCICICICVYVYIYISLSLSSSTVYICIWFPLVSHHTPMVCNPSPRLWTAYRHELKQLPPRWLPGTGCAMPVCPGYGWHGMGCWWWGGRWDSI